MRTLDLYLLGSKQVSWHWHGAYVQFKSQAEVANNIQNAMMTATERKLFPLHNKSGFKYMSAAGDVSLLFLSPQESNWVAFWGSTPAFCTLVFEMCGYSGVLFNGFDPLIPDDYGKGWDSWTYMIFQEGVIVDWFVSNPEIYFSSDIWSDLSITRIVTPYLRRWGARISNRLDGSTIRKMLFGEYADPFRGNLDQIRKFTRSHIRDGVIKEWLNLPTKTAMFKLSEILSIPFIGPDYDIFDIAIFHDVQRGLISPTPEDYYHHDSTYPDAYRRSITQIPRVDEFVPLIFQSEMSRMDILIEFVNTFYYI